jgi:aminoacyl tRNA synthase complex-interacting multifunctional protein 1
MSSEAPKIQVDSEEVLVQPASITQTEKPKKDKKPAPPKEPARPVDDVTRLRIIVGKLNKVWAHPDADKLWCEEVDCGEESGPRQIASGLREYYKTPEEMEGRLVLVLANLKARPMRGFVSHGMLLCASTEDRGVELIEPPAGSVLGERISIGDLQGDFDEVLNAKKNPWEAVCEHFHTGKEEPIAMFKDLPLMTSAGVPRAATLVDAPIR